MRKELAVDPKRSIACAFAFTLGLGFAACESDTAIQPLPTSEHGHDASTPGEPRPNTPSAGGGRGGAPVAAGRAGSAGAGGQAAGRPASESGSKAGAAAPSGGKNTEPTGDEDDAGTAMPGEPVAEPPAKARGRWTTYGFDHRNSQVNPDETILGPDNVAQLKERWRLHMVDGATSTPAVVDGVAYFGGWNGNVYAVDADSGEIRWQRRITESQVNSTPLIVGDRLYVAAGASLVALSRSEGTALFEVALDTHPAAMIWSSPKLVDGMLIIGIASFEVGITFEPTFIGSVVAVEAETGEEVWRVRTTGESDGSSFKLCVGGPGASVWSSAAIDEQLGLAFIGTGQNFAEPAGNCADSLLAIDYRRQAVGERIRWFVQYSKDDIFGIVNLYTGPDADVGAAPNLFEAGGRALVGAGDKGGSYRAFDRATGQLVWRTNLDMGPFPSFGGVTTTAAVHGDTIYVASNHIVTGQFILGDEDDPNDVATLYALDTATGKERWKVPLPAPMAGTFAVANGVLYHPVVNRMFYARDLATGKELWSTKLLNDPGAGPSIVDGRMYVSAGMALSAVLPTELGGYVSSFGLEDVALVTREARMDVIEPMNEAQCHETLKNTANEAACNACLCACDATAAGHCGSCSTLATCAVTYCALSPAGMQMRDCLANFCNAKLLPSYVFDRAVDAAPCLVRCADACGY